MRQPLQLNPEMQQQLRVLTEEKDITLDKNLAKPYLWCFEFEDLEQFTLAISSYVIKYPANMPFGVSLLL